MPKPVLMTVDDDPGVSRSVARDLRRRYGQDHRIVRAESGADALEALRELVLRGEPVAAILADYRMPQMNGIEFLEQAMDIAPHARRALLTAYADTDAAIQAINVVDIDHYLLKPWDPPEEKLYPVVDALIETWRAVGERPVEDDPARRAPLVGRVLHRARLPGPQRRALPLVLRRGPGGAAAAGRRPAATADDVPLLITPTAPRCAARRRRRSPTPSGSRTNPPTDFYDLDRDRRRPGRAGQRRVRRVGGPAHGAGGAGGDRWPGRAELAHRELPRLPRRRVRRAAHRPRAPAGREVRRRGAHRARRRRAGGARLGPRRALRRRQRDRRALRRARHRGLLPEPGRARRGRADRPRRLLRLGGHRGARAAPASTSTSSAAPTPQVRPQCSSPGTPPTSRSWCAARTSRPRCRRT